MNQANSPVASPEGDRERSAPGSGAPSAGSEFRLRAQRMEDLEAARWNQQFAHMQVEEYWRIVEEYGPGPMGPPSTVAADNAVRYLEHPEYDPGVEHANAWLENLNASLWFGERGTRTDVRLNEETSVGYEQISVSFQEQERLEGQRIQQFYRGTLDLFNADYTQETDAGSLSVSVGEGHMSLELLEFLRFGKILIYGGLGNDPMADDLRGVLPAGTELRDIAFSLDFFKTEEMGNKGG